MDLYQPSLVLRNRDILWIFAFSFCSSLPSNQHNILNQPLLTFRPSRTSENTKSNHVTHIIALFTPSLQPSVQPYHPHLPRDTTNSVPTASTLSIIRAPTFAMV